MRTLLIVLTGQGILLWEYKRAPETKKTQKFISIDGTMFYKGKHHVFQAVLVIYLQKPQAYLLVICVIVLCFLALKVSAPERVPQIFISVPQNLNKNCQILKGIMRSIDLLHRDLYWQYKLSKSKLAHKLPIILWGDELGGYAYCCVTGQNKKEIVMFVFLFIV